MKKIVFYLWTFSMLVYLLSACQKNEKPTPTGEKIQEIQAVLLPSDTGIYIPITDGKFKLNRTILEHHPELFDTAAGTLSRRAPRPTDLLRGNNRVSAGRNGKVGTQYEFYSGYTRSKVPTDWYFTRNGVRIAYLGTTSGLYATLAFNAPMDCGAYYDVEVDQQVWDPVTLSYITVTDFSEDSCWGYNDQHITGLGNEGSGADVVVYDINNNGIKDILFMAHDNPSGPNYYKYYIHFDVNNNGQPTSVSTTKIIAAGQSEVSGSGACIADIDRNGIPDLLLMCYDETVGTNTFVYKIGWNLNSSGDATSWSSNINVAGISAFGKGAKAALADIDKNGVLDIILMCADLPASGTGDLRYKIGWNLSSSGTTSTWTGPYYFTIGNIQYDFGLKLVDINNDGNLWMAIYSVINSAAPYGTSTNIDYKQISTSGTLTGVYKNATSYIYPMGASLQGTGMALDDLDGDGVRDLIMMTYDNPTGLNFFRYYTLFGFDIAPGVVGYEAKRAACTY